MRDSWVCERGVPFLIDGNNLLGSWRGKGVGSPGDGREEVVRRVCDFCRRRGARATLVFDGRPLRGELGAQTLGIVDVRFPGQGRDADALIREIVDASPHPGDWIVVTSDKPLYSYVRTRGAQVMRAHEWNDAFRSAKMRTARGAARRRPACASSGEKPEREADVEGWLKVFEKGVGDGRGR